MIERRRLYIVSAFVCLTVIIALIVLTRKMGMLAADMEAVEDACVKATESLRETTALLESYLDVFVSGDLRAVY